jgi:ribosomal protein S16
MDSRVKRDGRTLEDLGSYDPEAGPDAKVRLKVDRVQHWLSVGAEPTAPVAALLRKARIPVAAIRKAAAAKSSPLDRQGLREEGAA